MSADSKSKKIAFAMGGLGGANAHGVGFLQAAQDLDVKPDLISCTSGQIYWVWKYLCGENVGKEMLASISQQDVFPAAFPMLNQMWMLTVGKPNTFRPAIAEYFQRWFKPPASFTLDGLIADRLLPAQTLVPCFPKDLFKQISECFNKPGQIPIIFNSFAPQAESESGRGYEFVHLNDAAFEALRIEPDFKDVKSPVKTMYKRITPDAVEGALWLYMYGFDQRPDQEFEGTALVDGAYVRQFIIQELCQADVDTIFVPRPLFYGWKGPLPRNYYEAQAFTTDLWMNGSYAGEVAKVAFINDLLKEKNVGEALKAAGFQPIELVEVQPTIQQGFFEFFVEQSAIYEDAFSKSTRIFEEKDVVPHERLHRRVSAQ